MLRLINRFFSFILLLACVAGLFVPSVGERTNTIIIIALASVIFSSFFQVNLSRQSLAADFGLSLRYCLIRYILIPAVLFLLLNRFSHLYAMILLLTLLLPAAVSSPAFSLLFGGKADLSLKILLYSSFLSIVTIPFLLALFSDTSDVSILSMLVTLVWTILVPFLLHLPFRRLPVVRSAMLRYNSLITIISLSILAVVVTARNKDTILGEPVLVAVYGITSLILYGVMYFAGYITAPGKEVSLRRTLSISSGANNIGLGVTITALFFPGRINVFFIVAQIIWVLILIPVRPWLLGRGKL